VKPPALDIAAVDRASEHDRLWFEKHPGTSERTRPLIPGEFEGIEDEAGHVDVLCVRPGVRARRFGGRVSYFVAVDIDPGAGVSMEDLFGRAS